jgi:MHS family proline/betaine transporter-like MFS transporter
MVFGGFAPFIASWLIAETGAPISLSYFIIASAAISGLALLMMAETSRKELT